MRDVEVPDWMVQPEKPQEKTPKPLKHARSQAELTALRQRHIQICLVATNVLLSGLIALRTFGII